MNYQDALKNLQRAQSLPRMKGQIRQSPEDFIVDEELGFALSGDGPHAWLRVSKRLMNTQDVIHSLSKRYQIPNRDIGFSGLKDRNAVTTQWISLPIGDGGDLPQMDAFSMENDGFEIIESIRHQKKLKRGAHKSNQFRIIIRPQAGEPDGQSPSDQTQTEALLVLLKTDGVPNYFGEQRFGRNANNLVSAERYFNGELKKPTRQLRGFMLSAARSWIFNRVLSERVAQNKWKTAMEGDAIQFDGSGSFFLYDASDLSIDTRIQDKDCHPTGPLWGGGDPIVLKAALALERDCVKEMSVLTSGLVANGLKHQRRSLRVNLLDLQWRWLSANESNIPSAVDSIPVASNSIDSSAIDLPSNDNALELSFSLPAGCFATAVLRELVSAD